LAQPIPMQLKQTVTAFSKTAMNSPVLSPMMIKITERKNNSKDSLRFIQQTFLLYRIVCFKKKIKIYFYFMSLFIIQVYKIMALKEKSS